MSPIDFPDDMGTPLDVIGYSDDAGTARVGRRIAFAALSPRHWYPSRVASGSGAGVVVANQGVAGGSLAVAAGTFGALGSDARLRNAVCLPFTGSQVLISSLAASEFKFRHDGTGKHEWAIFASNSVAAGEQTLLATRVGGFGPPGCRTYLTVDQPKSVITNGTQIVCNISAPAGTFVANHPYLLEVSFLDGATPESTIWVNGVQVATETLATAPTTADPGVTLMVGGTTANLAIGLNGALADVGAFNRVLSAAERQVLYAYARDFGVPV